MIYPLNPIHKKEPKYHFCGICGDRFVWNESSSWYGSYDLEKDKEVVHIKACSDECRSKFDEEVLQMQVPEAVIRILQILEDEQR